MASPDASRSINIAFTGSTQDVARATRRVQATVRRAVKGIDGLTGTINIDADGKKAEAKVARLEQKIRNLRAQVQVQAETRRAQREVSQFVRRNDGRVVRINVVTNQLGNLRNQLGSVRDALRRAIPTNIITFGPLVVALTTAIVGLVAGLVGLISSLGFASAAFTAVIPAVLALGAAFWAVALASDAIQDSAGWNRLKGNIDTLKRIAAKELVPAFNEFARIIQRIIPLVGSYIRQLSKNLGLTLVQIGELLTSARATRQLEVIFDSGARSVANLGDAVTSLVGVILTLGAATAPVFERFTLALAGVLDRFEAWLNLKEDTGELAQFFEDSADELAQWGRIFRNIFTGLGGVFAAALGPGQQFADTLEEMTANFREWANSEEGQEKIKNFVQFFVDLDYGRLAQVAVAIAAIGVAIKGLLGVGNIIQGIAGLLSFGPIGLAIGALVVGLGLLAGAFVYAYTTSEPFREVVDGIANRIKQDFLPLLDRVKVRIEEFWENVTGGSGSDSFNSLIESVQKLWDKLKVAYNAIVAYVDDMVTRFENSDLEGFFGSVSNAVDRVVGAAGFLIDQFTALFNVIQPAREEGDNLNIMLSVLATAVDVVSVAISAFLYVWGAALAIVASAVYTVKEIIKWINNLDELLLEIWGHIKEIGRVWGEIWIAAGEAIEAFFVWVEKDIDNFFNGIRQDLSEEVEIWKERWQAIRDWVSGAVLATQNFITGFFRTITTSVNNFKTSAILRFNDVLVQARNKFNELKTSVTNSLSNMLTSFTNFKDRALGVVRGLIQSIKNLFSSMVITLPTPRLSGGLSGLISGFMGRALGGPVKAGQPYWVNEAGAGKELFVPDQDGRIINKSKAAGLGDGGTTVEVILTGLPEAFRDTVKVEIRENERDVKRRVGAGRTR